MNQEIERLHHVGHVLRNLEEGLALYRRLGFSPEPPVYPMLALAAGVPPRPFGAANTHLPFAHNFVELVTCVDATSRLPSGARAVPLEAPPELLPRITDAIRRTTDRVAACLARFQGLHILALESADVDATAKRLLALGVRHDGVSTVKRPIDTADGPKVEIIRCLELGEGAPEGRLAIAGKPSAPRDLPEHPNGAIGLVESVLCVAASELPETLRRYQSYLGRTSRSESRAHVFELDQSRVTLVDEAGLAAMLPGERPPALPAFVGFAVAVRDLERARRLLGRADLPRVELETGSLFVPAAAALGAAVIFRQE